jgi:hypothetical protein
MGNEAFVRGQEQADGGFADCEGRSDLYYTVFALDTLNALQVSLPLAEVEKFLRKSVDDRGDERTSAHPGYDHSRPLSPREAQSAADEAQRLPLWLLNFYQPEPSHPTSSALGESGLLC